MKLSEAIAKRVNELLKQRGWSQYSLYKKGGVPRSTICDVVNNKKKRVSTDTIYQISSTFGISLKDFFDSSIFDEVND